MGTVDTVFKAAASATATGLAFGIPLFLAILGRPQMSAPEVLEARAAPEVVWLLSVADSAIGEAEESPESADGASDESVADTVEKAPAQALGVAPRPDRGTPLSVTRTPNAASAAKAKKKKRNCQPDGDRIAPTGARAYTVDRTLVDAYAKKPGTLSSQAWLARHEHEGRKDGWRLGGIDCGNDLHEAGFRNGDVIHAVNGQNISSVPEALLAYLKLRRADVIRVQISRKGARRTMVYRLV